MTIEENPRHSETRWFMLPFMSQAQISIDWSHLPRGINYDEHFKLALYVRPSRCQNSFCDDRRVQQPNEETFPCLQPIELPTWFQDSSVNKHQQMNLTILALDDVLLKPEVQIVHALFLASTDSFSNTVTINIIKPSRAKIPSDKEIETRNVETRTLSPYVSWEEATLPKEHIFVARLTDEDTRTVSPPLNFLPRWSGLERGRILISMNTTIKSYVPTMKDKLLNVKKKQ